jgi:hypothetical protein
MICAGAWSAWKRPLVYVIKRVFNHFHGGGPRCPPPSPLPLLPPLSARHRAPVCLRADVEGLYLPLTRCREADEQRDECFIHVGPIQDIAYKGLNTGHGVVRQGVLAGPGRFR